MLFNLLKKYKKDLIIGPIVKLLEAIVTIVLPLIIASLIDNLDSLDTNSFIIYGISLLFLVFIGLVIVVIAQYIAARVSQSFGRYARDELFKHISTLSVMQIEKLGSSSLVNRLTNDITNIEIGINMWVRLLFRLPFLFLTSLVMTLIINYKIGIIFLVSIIILSICVYVIFRISSPLNKKTNEKLDKLSHHVRESLTNSRVIRTFNSTFRETNKFENYNNDTYNLYKKANIFSELLNPVTTLILNISIIVVICVGNIHINSSVMSDGNLIAIINYISQMLPAVVSISNLIGIYTRCYSSFLRCNEIFNIQPDMLYGSCKSFKYDLIEFNNVDFSFTNSDFIKGFNLKVKSGEKIGFIGLTGSGKSTILNLLNRTYDVTSGEICVFGNNIKNYDKSFLHSNICSISQKPSFLSASIKQNILLGRKSNIDEINSALIKANAYDFVYKYENNIMHILSNEANNLSGGEKQRIALSRAFIGSYPILIIDDSTSALDLVTESNVISNIFELESTIFIASQKISTIKRCDKIVVLDNGKIESVGTHDDLLKSSKLYKEIYDLQNY